MRHLVFVGVMLVACGEPKPMPEYAAAMQLYKDTVASTLDPSHQHEAYAKVAAALRAVPKRNRREHARAQELAAMIETAQEERRALLAKMSAPLPESAIRPPSEPPTFTAPPPLPTVATPMEPEKKKKKESADDCLKRWNDEMASCIRGCDPGCTAKPDGGFTCTFDSPEHQAKIMSCVQGCREKQQPCTL